MNFAPVAFQGQTFWNNLTLNFYQGNYTTGTTTWTNSVPGGPSATMNTGGFNKTTNGVTGINFSGTSNITLFTVSSGTWDNNAAGTLIIYMNITSTSNKSLWSKQTASSNGMGVDFTNNPLYLLRSPGSSNQVTTAANTSRGTHVYSFATNGGNDQQAQYYLDKVAPAMSFSTITNTTFSNGSPFRFGYFASGSWTDSPIQGVLNRIMFFNTKLDSGQIAQVVDYCTQNA